MKRNSDESGQTSFKKKFRFTTLDQLPPFPVSTIPDAKTEETFTCTGYFTGLSVEVFDPIMIQQIYQNGCYGKGSMSRSAPKSCNNSSSIETADHHTSSIPETLVLFLEEAYFLHGTLKYLDIRSLNEAQMTTEEIVNKFCELSPSFPKNYAAYLYLKKKNWVVKSGIKFGVLYNKGPKYYHASYVVLVRAKKAGEQPKSESITDFKGHFRIAENSSKELMILEVIYPEDVDLTKPLANLSAFKFVEMCNSRVLMNQDRIGET